MYHVVYKDSTSERGKITYWCPDDKEFVKDKKGFKTVSEARTACKEAHKLNDKVKFRIFVVHRDSEFFSYN